MNAIHRHPLASLRRSAAFTFIEVMIVIALLVTLTAIVLPMYSSHVHDARITKGVLDIIMMSEAIDSYYRTNGDYPDALEQIAHLIDCDKPDSWGNLYVYEKMIYDGDKKPKNARKDKFLKPLNTDYDLYSMGEDGETTKNLEAGISHDDIIRAADGGYIGLASEF